MQALTRSLLQSDDGRPASEAAEEGSAPSTAAGFLSALQRHQVAFQAAQSKASSAQSGAPSTLQRLAAFQQGIRATPLPPAAAASAPPAASDEAEEAAETGRGWLRHRLTFHRRPQDFEPGSGTGDGGGEDFLVLDPLGREGPTKAGQDGRGGPQWRTSDGGGAKRRRAEEEEGDAQLPPELRAQVEALTAAHSAAQAIQR